MPDRDAATLAKRKVVYFLGAGATRADYPHIPLMDDLLHEIVFLHSAASPLLEFLREVFGNHAVLCETRLQSMPRIDDVFTMIDARLSGRAPSPAGRSREQLVDIRRHLIASIGQVIARHIDDGHGRVATRFARALPESGSTIISTNYDVVMDNALLERRTKNVNYGIPIRQAVHRIIGRLEGRFDELHHYCPIPDSQEMVRRGGIPLLKLNGSLNWLYCPRCDELDITLSQSDGAVAILAEMELGRCGRAECTSPYEPVLVGPSLEQRYEHRVLRDTWSRAEAALAAGDHLVVIGYSLPDADYLIRAMLARTFAHRSHEVTVVTMASTPLEQARLEQRYKRVFSECTFDSDGFARFVERLAPVTMRI
jgi:hypothetical protein